VRDQDVRVSLLQVGPYEGPLDQHLARVLELGLRAAEGGSDLILLPELFHTPYFPVVRSDAWFDLAEELTGPSTALLKKLAIRTDTNVVGGIFRDAGDYHANSAVFVDRTGEIRRVYDKSHVPSLNSSIAVGYEDYYFKPGSSIETWTVDGSTVGPLICFDRSFPEAWRVQTLGGAELVIVLAASSGGRHAGWLRELRVRAMENGVWVAAVNKAGHEKCQTDAPEVSYYGLSCIIDPGGEVVAQLEAEPFSFLDGSIDLSLVAQAREALPLLSSRRPDLYAALADGDAAGGAGQHAAGKTLP
jgi:beta-ureidopropionase